MKEGVPVVIENLLDQPFDLRMFREPRCSKKIGRPDLYSNSCLRPLFSRERLVRNLKGELIDSALPALKCLDRAYSRFIPAFNVIIFGHTHVPLLKKRRDRVTKKIHFLVNSGHASDLGNCRGNDFVMVNFHPGQVIVYRRAQNKKALSACFFRGVKKRTWHHGDPKHNIFTVTNTTAELAGLDEDPYLFVVPRTIQTGRTYRCMGHGGRVGISSRTYFDGIFRCVQSSERMDSGWVDASLAVTFAAERREGPCEWEFESTNEFESTARRAR